MDLFPKKTEGLVPVGFLPTTVELKWLYLVL